MSFFENTRKPVGFGGKIMVAMMNLGHSPVARWGLRFLELAPDARVLDCGCGGGANIKSALTEKVMNLLIEMGKGFAFVGREYPLPIEGTEEYIDLLFYHLNLHCYVVVEVKIKEFKSRDIGQIGTYINIVDDIVKMDSDGKTIGLIICKEKNNVLAKYAVNSSNKPIAISAYELSNFLPENLATLLPSTDELESRLLLDEAVNENDNNNQ